MAIISKFSFYSTQFHIPVNVSECDKCPAFSNWDSQQTLNSLSRWIRKRWKRSTSNFYYLAKTSSEQLGSQLICPALYPDLECQVREQCRQCQIERFDTSQISTLVSRSRNRRRGTQSGMRERRRTLYLGTIHSASMVNKTVFRKALGSSQCKPSQKLQQTTRFGMGSEGPIRPFSPSDDNQFQ